MAFGSPGSNFYEILQPIEQTIHDFRLARRPGRSEHWQLQFGYALSIFENDLTAVRADNPCSGARRPRPAARRRRSGRARSGPSRCRRTTWPTPSASPAA